MNHQNYHKVYMNHVQSSTLLAQLATMWKSQTLCDAIIKTGSISTRAHRVVLVAACPMLQTMENATSGSHLEVRLASDIAQESVNTFLQYLYEGFMILTEDNCSDVEKIARLLQVDSVTKCCADFQKCLNRSAGSQFKYSFQEQTEFKHMRVSDLFKKQERSTKRAGDLHRPPSPGSKRQRLHRPSSPKIHDTSSMAESYGATSDPWERVPRLGSGFQGPGVIDIREDGFELVQTEPPKKDITGNQEPRKVQTSVSLSVSSQHNTSSDLRVVNVTGDSAPPVPHPVSKPSSAPPPITNMSGSSRDPITVSPITFHDSPSSSSSSVEISRSMPQSDKTLSKKEVDKQPQPTIHIPDYSDPQFSDINTNIGSRSDDNVSSTQYKSPYPVAMSQVSRPVPVGPPKPFASGSATQSESSPAFSDSVQSPGNQRPQATKERSDSLERPPSTGKAQDTGQGRPDDKDIDLSIVKVESAGQRDIENLQMYMSEGGMTMNVQAHRSEDDDPDPNNSFDLEEPPGEWSRDEMSNEGSNVSGGDQSGNWYMGQFKGMTDIFHTTHSPFDQKKNVSERPKTSFQDRGHSEIKTTSSNKGPNVEILSTTVSQEKLSCVSCSVTFDTRESLFRHVQAMHNHPNEHYLVFCEFCGRGFKSKEGFLLHTKLYHSNDQSFPKCNVCQKRFHCAASLQRHAIKHSQLKPFSCSYCSKSFKFKGSLRSHSCKK